jgi:RNA polymerase primary sigma factor
MHEQVRRCAAVEQRLTRNLARTPREAELAEALDWTPAHLKRVREAMRTRPSSLDARKSDRLRAGEVADDGDGADTELAIERVLIGDAVQSLLCELTEREQFVIRHRFAVGEPAVRTLEEVGKMMGLTRERVRQIEHKTLGKLRVIAGKKGLHEWIAPGFDLDAYWVEIEAERQMKKKMRGVHL